MTTAKHHAAISTAPRSRFGRSRRPSLPITSEALKRIGALYRIEDAHSWEAS
jgi:hypothetical protein